MEIFLKLFAISCIPVLITIIFCRAEKSRMFSERSYVFRQVVIGLAFGLAAIFGTECGVNVGGATANARDAAPLCAGLLFGAPAGIIAGLIGGIERWFSSAGDFSRLACSVATIFAGFYAAFLRKYLFDNKTPSWGLGFAIGMVMEIIHMLTLFLTHFYESEEAFRVVRICTIPMVLVNGISLMLAIISFMYLRGDHLFNNRQRWQISRKLQSVLLVCVVGAWLLVSGFFALLEKGLVKSQSDLLLQTTLEDVRQTVQENSDNNLLRITKNIAQELNNTQNLDSLARKYNVIEINIINPQGVIINSNIKKFIGFNMASGEQSREFMALLGDVGEYAQSYQSISFDETIYRKYAGVSLRNGGFVQVGYDTAQFYQDIAQEIRAVAHNRHIGKSGYILIVDDTGEIVSAPENFPEKRLGTESLEWFLSSKEQIDVISIETKVIGDEICNCKFATCEGYYIFAIMPNSELEMSRNIEIYVIVCTQIIVFAFLFVMIYFLIKRLVVDDIQATNQTLGEITQGNLDAVVNVRQSEEFSMLSDGINSTVTALKQAIAEAAARIDRELEFARNIQLSALPSVFPPYPQHTDFDIYASMQAAKEVGGDFYDFYLLGEDKLAFLIADVSGKGIPAAMFMMTAKTMIKDLAESGMDVEEVFTQANAGLCEGNEAEMFVTAWMGFLDLKTGLIQFANAGHNPPLVCRQNGQFAYLKAKPGFVLAGMDGIRYRRQELQLEPGDVIYLYTDGVTEATNAQEELYGELRLQAHLNTVCDASAELICKTTRQNVDEFVAEAPQFDDMTMIAIRYIGRDTI